MINFQSRLNYAGRSWPGSKRPESLSGEDGVKGRSLLKWKGKKRGKRERRRKCKKRKGKKWRRSCPYGPRIEGTSSLSPIPFPLLPFCARIASKMRRGVAKPCWNEGGGRRTRLPGTPVIRWSSFHMILRIGHPSSAPPLLPPLFLPQRDVKKCNRLLP